MYQNHFQLLGAGEVIDLLQPQERLVDVVRAESGGCRGLSDCGCLLVFVFDFLYDVPTLSWLMMLDCLMVQIEMTCWLVQPFQMYFCDELLVFVFVLCRHVWLHWDLVLC